MQNPYFSTKFVFSSRRKIGSIKSVQPFDQTHYRPFKINGGKKQRGSAKFNGFWKCRILTSMIEAKLCSMPKSKTSDFAILA